MLAHLPDSPKAHGTQLKKSNLERDNPERQSSPIQIQAKDREQGEENDGQIKQCQRVHRLRTNVFWKIFIVKNYIHKKNYINTSMQIQITQNWNLKLLK